MNNERDRRSEDRLSNTYRALAEERAPDYLNEKVLRLASRTRTRYSRARAWMRPAAWAAVIGLSLAIVLDMTRLPQSEPDSIGISIPDSRKAGDRRWQTRDTASENPAAQAEASVPAPAATSEQSTDAERLQPPSSATAGSDGRSKDEFVPKDMTILRDAEEMARTRAGSAEGPVPPGAVFDEAVVEGDLKEETANGMTADRAVGIEDVQAEEDEAEGSPAVAPSATLAKRVRTAPSRYCAEAVRKQPESWIACIRELEEDGRETEARDEYEAFRRVFPDFDAQDADK